MQMHDGNDHRTLGFQDEQQPVRKAFQPNTADCFRASVGSETRGVTGNAPETSLDFIQEVDTQAWLLRLVIAGSLEHFLFSMVFERNIHLASFFLASRTARLASRTEVLPDLTFL
jgi:hypothetical protein